MLRTKSLTGLSTILQLLMAVVDEYEFDKSGDRKTNLSNLFILKKSTKASYLTFKDTKRGSGYTKKRVKADKVFNYLSPGIKKAFNLLGHAFT